MSNDPDMPPANSARLIFGAVVFLAFVWFALFFVLPMLTGQPGVAQDIQSDLQERNGDAAEEK
ncbi:MAG: hypothetical protein ACON4V_02020 [Parvibaculales bacterium]